MGKINPGVLNNMMAYRVYIAPVLSFISQLDPLPTTFGAGGGKVCEMLFPGGRGWMTPGCLKNLKALSFPTELPDLHRCALAAKDRVHKFENALQGGLKISAQIRRFGDLGASGDNLIRGTRFPEWFNNLIIFNLIAAYAEFAGEERIGLAETPSILGHEELPEQCRDEWQAQAFERISLFMQTAAHQHLRRRLDRWNIPTLEGHRCNRAMASLETLIKQVPPRVLAVVIRALCNGWITGRCFQHSGHCVFACSHGGDSIEHYALCPEFHAPWWKHFCISRPPIAHCLEDFLCIKPCTNTLPGLILIKGDALFKHAVTLRALSLYALYHTIGAVRHRVIASRDAQDAFARYVVESVRGHSGTISLISGIRARARDRFLCFCCLCSVCVFRLRII